MSADAAPVAPVEHVIVTGGSSGIGLAVASLYARRGARLSLIARGLPGLEAASAVLRAAGATVHVEAADVADAEALDCAMRACEAALGPCTILVASAGIVEPGAFEAQSATLFNRQIAVNVAGCANAARAVYPGMTVRGGGRILFVSSGAGLIGIPGYAAYCASKYALRGLAEALRFEGKSHGVTVSIAFPPDTDTPQLAREIATRPRAAGVIMGAVKPWSAEAVAEKLVRAIDKGRFEVFFGATLWALGRFGPLIRPALLRWFDSAIRRRGM